VTAFGRPQRAVSRIEHHGSRINVKTSRGTVGAARVIVTVPTAAIADEHLVFDPQLPDKVAAAQACRSVSPTSSSSKSREQFRAQTPSFSWSVRPGAARR
jgi:monoamine oxidase